jgi:hypothetical protein
MPSPARRQVQNPYLERLFRQRLARRPGTNDDNKSCLWTARGTKINSPDPPLMAVGAAYATPPLLPFTHQSTSENVMRLTGPARRAAACSTSTRRSVRGSPWAAGSRLAA